MRCANPSRLHSFGWQATCKSMGAANVNILLRTKRFKRLQHACLTVKILKPSKLRIPLVASGVKLAYLFGSRAKRSQVRASDYDVAVLFGRDYSLSELGRVAFSLSKSLGVGPERVDVVALDDAPVDFAFKVISEGEEIYARSEEDRVSYEYEVIKTYLDLEAFLQQRSKRILERITGGLA